MALSARRPPYRAVVRSSALCDDDFRTKARRRGKLTQKRVVFGMLAAFCVALSSHATAGDGYSHLTCKSVAKHSGFSLESSLQVKLNLRSRKVCLGDDCDEEIPVTRTGKFIT